MCTLNVFKRWVCGSLIKFYDGIMSWIDLYIEMHATEVNILNTHVHEWEEMKQNREV